MKLDWDDPFGSTRRSTPGNIARFKKATGSLVVPAPTIAIDVDKIRVSHQKLRPYFEELYEAAAEMCAAANPLSSKTSELGIVTTITYRKPDAPWCLETFTHETTAHTVILSETGEQTHPLVNRLFPLRAVDDLPESARQALNAVFEFELASRLFEAPVRPTHIRAVFPELLKSIMDWISDIEGPINDVVYVTRKMGRDIGNATVLHLN